MGGVEDRDTLLVCEAVKAVDIAVHPGFQEIGDVGEVTEDPLDLFRGRDFVRMGGAHPVVRLRYQGEPRLLREGEGFFQVGHPLSLDHGDPAFAVFSLHPRLELDVVNGVEPYPLDIEIGPEAGLGSKPVLVERFYPAHPAVPMNAQRHGAVELVVFFHGLHVIVFGQGSADRVLQALPWSVADAEHRDPQPFQGCTELVELLREMG